MKNDDSANSKIYQACIAWDIPTLRKAGDEDVDHFTRTIQLLPSAFSDPAPPPSKRMTPLRRAAEGLRAELTGDTDIAREHYEVVAKKHGLPGILGTLLIAWMPTATEKDFKRVERKLSTLNGRGTHDVIARSHCKLATWSYDHGWTDRSRHHFEEARRYAGKNLGMTLDSIGHWFGKDRILYLNPHRDDMTALPWIGESVDLAARTFVEKQLRDSVKSPWARTWTFGSATVEGIDIQSAEMQASWAGAMWMLPQINRQHAAIILARSNDPDDVARAIALWAKGGGQDINKLVSTKETALTEDAIDDLLVDQLHEGRSVRDLDIWLDICHALWAELPDRLVDDIVRNYQGPARETRLHSGTGAKELGLFGKLLVRSSHAAEKVYSFDDWGAGLLARAMHPELLAELPPRLLERLLRTGISEVVLADRDWADANWSSLVTCWTLLDDKLQHQYRGPLLAALPDSEISTAVAIAPDLVPSARAEARMRTSLALLAKELRDSATGSWTGWSIHPAIEVARLAAAQGHISDDALRLLVAIAVAPTTNSMQRRSCLAALTSLAQAGLVERDQVAEAFAPITVRSVMTDDAAVDQRLEDVTRLTLSIQFGKDHAAAEGPLLAASRDPDTAIRVIAVDAVCQLSLQRQTSPSFDATLLGALYDPHPRVQAKAIPALWHGAFESDALCEVARARVVDIFPNAHRELRASIALQIATAKQSDDPYIRILEDLVSRDRSWVVRTAARRSA